VAEEAEEAPIEAEADRDVPAAAEEDELEPPFEGEMIEDSIGWVQTEPQEDYYTGWSDEEEEPEVEEVEYEWVRDEIEEERDLYRPERKKKSKKRRPKEQYFGEEVADRRRKPRSRNW
jgi:hypothetical protein